jgi:hypothetical protein
VKASKEELKQLFAKELQKYSTEKSSFKEYYLSMKDLNVWLKEREK